MATVSEIYTCLDTLLPRSLSCSWDNDGLMVCADGAKEVKTILFALDITMDVIEEAHKLGAELVISHHPLIFKGLRHINGEDVASQKVIALLKYGISAMSFHTRLDEADGGINDLLASELSLTSIDKFEAEEGIHLRVGSLPREMRFEDFCLYVKETLGAPQILASKGKETVSRVALLGGAGGDDFLAAKASGADVYLTGEAKYHELLDAAEMGFSVVTAGHDFTELCFARYFEKALAEHFPDLHFEKMPKSTVLYRF